LSIIQHGVFLNTDKVSMKHFRGLIVITILGLLGAGCWPARLMVTPPATGLVLDAQTQQPISHAKLVMCQSYQVVNGDYIRYSDPPNAGEVLSNALARAVYTDDNGHFSVHSTHEWVIYYPSPTRLIEGMLVVQKDGYQTNLVPVSKMLGQQAGTIRLEPLGK
jgi:hypothetical protein